MSFADMVAADNRNVFLNCDEFAELHTVIYDGVTYDGEDHSGIPIVMTRLKQSKTVVPVTDHVEGLRTVSALAHIALEDLNGTEPEEGAWIEISDGQALGRPFMRRYKIVTCGLAMGMLSLELEAKED